MWLTIFPFTRPVRFTWGLIVLTSIKWYCGAYSECTVLETLTCAWPLVPAYKKVMTDFTVLSKIKSAVKRQKHLEDMILVSIFSFIGQHAMWWCRQPSWLVVTSLYFCTPLVPRNPRACFFSWVTGACLSGSPSSPSLNFFTSDCFHFAVSSCDTVK